MIPNKQTVMKNLSIHKNIITAIMALSILNNFRLQSLKTMKIFKVLIFIESPCIDYIPLVILHEFYRIRIMLTSSIVTLKIIVLYYFARYNI